MHCAADKHPYRGDSHRKLAELRSCERPANRRRVINEQRPGFALRDCSAASHKSTEASSLSSGDTPAQANSLLRRQPFDFVSLDLIFFLCRRNPVKALHMSASRTLSRGLARLSQAGCRPSRSTIAPNRGPTASSNASRICAPLSRAFPSFQLPLSRRAFSTTPQRRHGHITPPKPGEE